MSASISDVRNAIKTRLATISGLRANATEPASPNPPAAWPIPRAGTYHADQGDNVTFPWVVRVVVNPSDLNRGQTALDAYLSPTGTNSIKAALEADPSLGGVVDSLSVTGWTFYGRVEFEGGLVLLGGDVAVEIFA